MASDLRMTSYSWKRDRNNNEPGIVRIFHGAHSAYEKMIRKPWTGHTSLFTAAVTTSILFKTYLFYVPKVPSTTQMPFSDSFY